MKNIDVRIPKNKLTVITGPSGSGKSSLAMDTLYSECLRRFLQCMSSPTEQVQAINKTAVIEKLDGLCPAVGITQSLPPLRTRSTLGTLSELSLNWRRLFLVCADFFPSPSRPPLKCWNNEGILKDLQRILLKNQLSKCILIAPYFSETPVTPQTLSQLGWNRIILQGQQVLIEDLPPEPIESPFEVVIDRLVFKPQQEQLGRLRDSLFQALKLGNGWVKVLFPENDEELSYTTFFFDTEEQKKYPAPTLQHFNPAHPLGSCPICKGLGCAECDDTGYSSYTQKFLIHQKSIAHIEQMTVRKLIDFVDELSKKLDKSVKNLLSSIHNRLLALEELGLGYLSLNRSLASLSRGEIQRIKIANHLDEKMSGILYILDEPALGLHSTDQDKVLHILKKLLLQGNTLVVVEHHKKFLQNADWIIEMGPEAGEKGGMILYSGPPQDIPHILETKSYLAEENWLNSKKLEGSLKKLDPQFDLPPSPGSLKFSQCSFRNIKNLCFQIPLQRLSVITGPSGVGKSSLVEGIILPALGYFPPALKPSTKKGKDKGKDISEEVPDITVPPQGTYQFENKFKFERVSFLDQSPLGKHSRSSPATYLGIYEDFRVLFAETKTAKLRGIPASHFSLNTEGGRCAACKGEGKQKLQLPLMTPIEIPCELCEGQRFQSHILEITFKGKNISEVLDFTVDEAHTYFRNFSQLTKKFEVLQGLGLGYMKLGQTANSLSGGEAQRLRLAEMLQKQSKGSTLLILDEPTAGLHFSDILNLLTGIFLLLPKNYTFLAIENQEDFVTNAHHHIELK